MNNLESFLRKFFQEVKKEKSLFLVWLFLTVVYAVSLSWIYQGLVDLTLLDKEFKQNDPGLINQRELEKAIANLSKKNGNQKDFLEEEKATTGGEIKLIKDYEATQSGAINVSEIKVEVLNGSGVAGSASKMAERFTAIGYDVVKIDNAETQDYQKTVIGYKKLFKAHTERFQELIKDEYHSFELQVLPDNFAVDISIVLGR